MLTPQEVSERAFSKSTFGGYNMAQVDEFLDILTGDYSSLYSENAVLKSKMKVLVDKVEEYRSTEEAMRKALMSAQRMADELVAEAEQRKTNLLRDAEAAARQQMDELTREIEAEELRLKKARESTAAFVSQVRAMQSRQLEFLEHLGELYPEDTAAEEEKSVDEAVSEIDDHVQQLLAAAISDVAAANQKKAQQQPEDMSDTAEFILQKDEDQPQRHAPEAPYEEEPEPPRRPQPPMQDELDRTRRIDFGELQFGRDYEIK